MSILIDELKSQHGLPIKHGNDSRWYLAKPIQYKSIGELIKRLKDAIRVIRGKSFAVHYKCDE